MRPHFHTQLLTKKCSAGAITSCLQLPSNWVTPPSGLGCCSLGNPWPWALCSCMYKEKCFQPLVFYTYTYMCIWLTFNVQQSSRIRDRFLLFPHWLKSYNRLQKMSQTMMNTLCHRSVTTNHGFCHSHPPWWQRGEVSITKSIPGV